MASVKKTKKYSCEDMVAAINAVRDGMSVAAASKAFKIPRITLLYKCKGKYKVDARMCPSTILKEEEEILLVNWLFKIAALGFPATRSQLLDSVQILIKKLNRENPFKNGRPGRKWFDCFMKRHPELTERFTQNLIKSRSELTEDKIKNWFTEILQYLKENALEACLRDPRRIFNADETAFFLSPKGMKCLIKKGDKTAYNFISNNEKECLTTLISANAAGELLPPMIIYKYERIPPHIANLMPKGWAIAKSESGWMTSQTFYEFVANIFFPWIVSSNIRLPVILFVDGHSSHLTMELSDFCYKNKIILIALYPNATHIIQPMDVGIFHPLKSAWKNGVQMYKTENNGQSLKKEFFAPLLEKVIESSVTSDMIKAAFRGSGLFPFDPNGINFDKYFKKEPSLNKNISNQYSNSKISAEFLSYFEKVIGHKKIEKFQSEKSLSWSGDIEDKNLFLTWKKILSEYYESEHFKEREENSEEYAEIEQTKKIKRDQEENKEQGIPEKLETQQTPTKASTSRDNDFLKNIPSPFKSSLFWPNTPITTRARKNKEKIPSVATSDTWREYHRKKQQKKIKEQEEKEKRKTIRLQNKKLKLSEKLDKCLKSAKRRTTRHHSSSSSNSVVSIHVDSEDEVFEDDPNFRDKIIVDDYVVTKIENVLFPALIVSLSLDEFLVSIMAPNDEDWMWPKKAREFWVSYEKIIAVIKKPVLKSKDVFAVPEMKKYLQ